MTIKMHRDTRYGRLTLTSGEPYRLKGRTNLSYRCICDCGTQVFVEGHRLRGGVIASCGCLQRESQQRNLSKKSCRIILNIKIKDTYQ